MTFEIGCVLALLAAMVYLFLTEKLRVELTAFCGLLVMVFAGFVPVDRAFVGFSSPAVITMFSIFFISAGLARTGVADAVGRQLSRWSGGRENATVILLMLLAAALSAFMNNVAAAAVLMPAVISVSRHSGISPSRLFMPLAFGAILGGTTTLVGTPPNLLTGEMAVQLGLNPIGLFDFAPVGLVLLAVGILYMLLFGRRMLPERLEAKQGDRAQHLIRAYRVDDRLTSIRVVPGSVLEGQTLDETQLSAGLGASVVGVRRGRKRILAPGPDFRLEADDLVVVDALYFDLQSLLAMRGVAISEAQPGHLSEIVSQVHGLVLRLPRGSGLVGRTLQQLRFRERFEVLVVGLRRGKDWMREELGRRELQRDDEILVLADDAHVAALQEQKSLEVVGEVPLSELMEDRLFVIEVPTGSQLDGLTLRDSRLGELVGLTVIGIVRGGSARLMVSGGARIEAGDELLVIGNPETLLEMLELGPLELDPIQHQAKLESESVRMVEAVVAPRSSALDKTLRQIHFRQRFGLQVLAVWRVGEAIHRDLADLPLQVGDALLLHGDLRKIDQLSEDQDFVLLDHESEPVRRYSKAPAALAALAVMVGVVVSGVFPVHVAAFTGAVITVLFGALTMEEAYRAIEWKALFLVAAILPVGTAMETTGAAHWVAGGVARIGEAFGPYAFLAAIVVLASFLSQTLDGAPTVVILAPVVALTAEKLGVSPTPMMMAVGLAASAAFMTPFSQKASLLVMSAGGYRVSDFVRVGTPLTLMVLVLLVILIPIFFPF